MTEYFPAHTIETKPDEAREALLASQEKLGFIPSMLAKLAEAPPLLMGYQALVPFFDQTSLNPTERLVVFLVASHRHNCDFCVTAHSWAARGLGINEEVISALREGRAIGEPKLEALRAFVAAMQEKRGGVSDEEKRAFFEAGYTSRQALDVILGVALKTITNYTNTLARTPPNAEFGDALWRRRA